MIAVLLSGTSVSDNWFRFSLTFNFKEVLPWISDAGGNRPCVKTYLLSRPINFLRMENSIFFKYFFKGLSVGRGVEFTTSYIDSWTHS